ncbi:Glycoprotein 3-alpha-L-fucosyltransferase A, partial [Pseudolycoriella hygida]
TSILLTNAQEGEVNNNIHLPWYFAGGKRYPKPATESQKMHKRVAKLLVFEDPYSDRISNQLMFVPPNYEKILKSGKLKTVLLYNNWNMEEDRDVFTECPVSTCQLTTDRDEAINADLILYKDIFVPTYVPRSPNQIFMIYYLESPYNTISVNYPPVFNWTATYRKDSTIVAPYEKWEYYDPRVKQMEQNQNFAQNKTKKVAWFVSNCKTSNGRLAYAKELQKHINVDIYGRCGGFQCFRNHSNHCFEILNRDYKFYLAFENSNCMYYITEKFFVNALNNNILPIVMGARPEDYESSAPYRSYIHVDEFESPKHLADYLHILDKSDDLYNSYFKWKGTGEFINTYFWCRVCAMLHDDFAITSATYYDDINEWWRPVGTCTSDTW